MEDDDRQVTTVFTVQPSFHHRHSTNPVSWSATIVGKRAVTPHIVVHRWWEHFMILGLLSADGEMTVGLWKLSSLDGRRPPRYRPLGSLSCLMQHRGFDKPLGRIFLVEGTFLLVFTWVLTPFPQNPFGWEYKSRSSLCTQALRHMDSKDPDVHFLDRWMPATKTHPACTINKDGMWLPQWLDRKNGHIGKNLTQNGDPHRFSWGTQEKPEI